MKRRLCVALVALGLIWTPAAFGAGVVSPPKFMDRPFTFVTAEHPTSGLPGFPARDYGNRSDVIVRAPFNGCVPSWRPWGWASYQNPALGFGGMRIYLRNTATGQEAYGAHLGFLYLRPGQCFKQGDPFGRLWGWPNDVGRTHIHIGYQGGDPLRTLVDRNGNFLIRTGPVWTPKEKIFPRPRLVLAGVRWEVRAGQKILYKGGRTKAELVYKRQKLARRINLHFKLTYEGSPLVGFGLVFVRQFRARDLDPRLGAAIASCETSGGTKGNGPVVNNDFGLLLPGGGHREFDSRKDAIIYLAKLLSGPKYEGRDTIREIGARYSPVGAGNDPQNKNSRWVDCVEGVYKKLGGTRYL